LWGVAPRSSVSDPGVSRLRVLRAAVLLPGTVAVAIPALLVALFGADVDLSERGSAGAVAMVAGAALIVFGVLLWLETVRLFASVGRGTLAPWDPTRKLVVRGPYRRVRNPMISAVTFVLLGEALVLGSIAILIEFAIFALMNAIYIPLAEEPGLLRRFGDEYEEYRRAVPRWIPRRSPWTPGEGA
jgi:protein-S-isoprenylcysteine O-methyltransferase Ste14